MKCCFSIFVALTLLLVSHSVRAQQEMQLTSIAFSNDGEIPVTYTCDDQNISPPLAWVNAPPSTQSFALIMMDNDATAIVWQHWVVFDIPARINELSIASNGLIEGVNSSGFVGYLGPCPPDRGVAHQYSFVLFALDVKRLDLLNKEPSAAELTEAMNGHVIAQAVLNGQYTRGVEAS